MSALTQNSNNLGIQDLETGISSSGMMQYLEELKLGVFDKAQTDLQNVAEIQTALDLAWQGHAKDVFVTQFNYSVTHVSTALSTEYNNLVNQLNNVKSDFYAIDNSLMNEE